MPLAGAYEDPDTSGTSAGRARLDDHAPPPPPHMPREEDPPIQNDSLETGTEAMSGVLPGFVVFLLCSTLALTLAWTGGGRESGFGAYEDEPSHLVSGLMIRDYLADELGSSPIEFAKRTYLHYPKVAVGHWPPGFPAMIGGWVLLFGDSHASLLSLMAALAGAVSALLFTLLRPLAGMWIALAGALVFVLVPEVQAYTFSTMTELPLALTCTLATVGFGLWLDSRRGRYLVLFASAAIAGIYIKGSALFLVLLPPLAIAFSGRFSSLRSVQMWISGLVVGAVCAPWYLFTMGVAHTTWGGGQLPSSGYALSSLGVYSVGLLDLLGVLGAMLVLFGATTIGRMTRRRGLWSALLAWPVCHLIGLLLTPTGEDVRHLVVLTPAWIALWGAGIWGLAAHLRRTWQSSMPSRLVCALALVGFGLSFERPTKDYRGYEQAARYLLSEPRFADARLLIAGDSKGEGLFIGDVALREERPGHVILRASKLLASGNWHGSDYEQRFETIDEVAAELEGIPVGVVLLDRSTIARHWFRHHEQLEELFTAHPDRWLHIASYDIWRDGVLHSGALELYELDGHQDMPRRALSFDDIVGRELPSF